MAASDSAPVCANNCGFFGNPTTRNLCSQCYANFLRQQIQQSQNQEPELRTRRCLWPAETSTDPVETSEPAAKGKNRCKTCNKKVGLLGFKCRCGDLFCGNHRLPEEHSCGVDHKDDGRRILANQIVECKADKLEFRA